MAAININWYHLLIFVASMDEKKTELLINNESDNGPFFSVAIITKGEFMTLTGSIAVILDSHNICMIRKSTIFFLIWKTITMSIFISLSWVIMEKIDFIYERVFWDV